MHTVVGYLISFSRSTILNTNVVLRVDGLELGIQILCYNFFEILVYA